MMVTDFHSHVLPGIDDGSQSLGESLKLLRMEAEQGIRQVVATPHFYGHRDTLEGFLSRREAAATQLKQAIKTETDLPQVLVAAEVYYFNGISETSVLKDLTVEGTDCVLIEMPMQEWTESMYREIARIPERQGLQPIIAHIDRYIRPLRRNSHVAKMEQLPVWIQANGEFFLNKRTRSMAMRMLRERRIHLLGSDCHNLNSRKPNLGQTAEIIRSQLGSGAIENILRFQKEMMYADEKDAYSD